MSIWTAIEIAFQALWANRLRSLLTMLGIIIGVGSTIVVLTMGASVENVITEQIREMGTDLIRVAPGNPQMAGRITGRTNIPVLTEKDVEAIRKEVPGVRNATGFVFGSGRVVKRNLNLFASILGIQPAYLEMGRWTIASGRPLVERDVKRAAKVALIGSNIAIDLFDQINPVGQRIRVQGVPFTIIGVLEEKEQSFFGSDRNDYIFIPITTAKRRILGQGGIRADEVNQINISVFDPNKSGEVKDIVKGFLDLRHGYEVGTNDSFYIASMSDILKTTESIIAQVNLVLTGIASIALLVGGIGIMNIMLVSVTERTQEIGLRMAVGGSEEDIHMQFLIEAVTLSVLGGVLGILLGLGLTFLIAALFDLKVLIQPMVILFAVFFSGTLGIIFGYYPSKKAAKLKPIEALRYE